MALLLIVVGTIVGIATMTSSDIEMMISGNQRSLQQVFEAAEAGIDEGIGAFFIDAPPRGAARPPIADLSRAPWGIPATQDLENGCGYTVCIKDMEVSKSPPPGYDPGQYRTFYYQIQSFGGERDSGLTGQRGVREAEQVVGVVYKIR